MAKRNFRQRLEDRAAELGSQAAAAAVATESVAVPALVVASEKMSGDEPEDHALRPGAKAWSQFRVEVGKLGVELGAPEGEGFGGTLRFVLGDLLNASGLNETTGLAAAQRVLEASGHPWAIRLAQVLPLLLMMRSRK